MQNEILRQLKNAGVVPVVKIDSVDKAIPLAKALIAGGLSTIEITFRSDAAFGAIKALVDAKLKTQEGKPLLIGAGTVINAEIAKKAIDAGSQFLVSPGTNAKTIAYCRAESTPIIPGVSSASDIEGALEQGLNLLKFFPSEALGGLKMLQALRGPFPQVSFMPTGGINRANLKAYAAEKSVFAIGGSWMVSPEDIESKNWEKITKLSSEALALWKEGRKALL